MTEIAVNKSIGDERPDVGSPPARPHDVRHHGWIVARGDEGKQQEKCIRLLCVQHEGKIGMHESQHREEDKHDEGDIENSFAAGCVMHGNSDISIGQASKPLAMTTAACVQRRQAVTNAE